MRSMLDNGSWAISESCENLIAVLPICVHDPDDPEDVLKFEGDDAYDSSRYGLYSKLRPAVEPREFQIDKMVVSTDPTIRAIQARLAELDVDKRMGSLSGVVATPRSKWFRNRRI